MASRQVFPRGSVVGLAVGPLLRGPSSEIIVLRVVHKDTATLLALNSWHGASTLVRYMGSSVDACPDKTGFGLSCSCGCLCSCDLLVCRSCSSRSSSILTRSPRASVHAAARRSVTMSGKRRDLQRHCVKTRAVVSKHKLAALGAIDSLSTDAPPIPEDENIFTPGPGDAPLTTVEPHTKEPRLSIGHRPKPQDSPEHQAHRKPCANNQFRPICVGHPPIRKAGIRGEDSCVPGPSAQSLWANIKRPRTATSSAWVSSQKRVATW